jgi:hypothetical protein
MASPEPANIVSSLVGKYLHRRQLLANINVYSAGPSDALADKVQIEDGTKASVPVTKVICECASSWSNLRM